MPKQIFLDTQLRLLRCHSYSQIEYTKLLLTVNCGNKLVIFYMCTNACVVYRKCDVKWYLLYVLPLSVRTLHSLQEVPCGDDIFVTYEKQISQTSQADGYPIYIIHVLRPRLWTCSAKRAEQLPKVLYIYIYIYIYVYVCTDLQRFFFRFFELLYRFMKRRYMQVQVLKTFNC